MADFFTSLVLSFNYFVLVYFLLINAVYILLALVSFFTIRKYLGELIFIDQYKRLFRTSFYKPISVLAPAYNEEATIVENVRSLLSLRYPEFEIIVINDGSKDETLGVLTREFSLRPSFRYYEQQLPHNEIRGVYSSDTYENLVVVDKVNGGKSDALNAGITISRYPLVAAIDADSILEHDVMQKLVQPFLDDPHTVAAGGIVRVVNGCTVESGEVVSVGLSPKWLPNFQIVEYLRAFLFGRVGWEAFNALMVISGAFGLFRKEAVIDAGGYDRKTVGEDMELVVRLHRRMREQKKPYRIAFIPEPVCWTEVPESLKILSRQRNRWQRGLIETLLRHRHMMFNPRYGAVGILAAPFFLFFEMLGPIIEFLGWIVFPLSWWFGIVDAHFAVLFFLVAVFAGMVLSVSSLVLEELSYRKYPRYRHIARLFLFSLLENFGYRQLTSFWRLKGTLDFLRRKTAWGEMERIQRK